MPRNVAVLVSGLPGSGKSTMCTTLALACALRGDRVLWVSPEEGAGPTTARRFSSSMERLGVTDAAAAPVRVSDARDLRDAHEEIVAFEKDGGQVVFIDSLTVLRAGSAWWEDLCHSQMGVVGIAHLNTRGGPMGGQRAAYDPDVHVVVEDFQAHVVKSRWYDERAPRTWAIDAVDPLPRRDPVVIPFPKRSDP